MKLCWQRPGRAECCAVATSYTQPSHDARHPNHPCRTDGACLWQLPQCVPHALACGRKCRGAPLALQELRTGAHVVGKCAGADLACSARPLPYMRLLDRLALSLGGAGSRNPVGRDCLAVCLLGFRRGYGFVQSARTHRALGNTQRKDASCVPAHRLRSVGR